MDTSFDFKQLQSSIQALYNLAPNDPFTMKWVDDEGDPCMLTCDEELQESIRLFNANKEPFLAVHGMFINLSVYHIFPLNFSI